MAALLLTVVLGGILAVGTKVNWSIMSLVLVNAFAYLYIAHLNDTYFDVKRGEYGDRKVHQAKVSDDSYLARWGFGTEIPNAPILPLKYYLVGIYVSAAIGTSIVIYISYVVGYLYALLALSALIMALTYSAGVDRIPILGDTLWVTGVILAFWCGYYTQNYLIDMTAIILAIPLYISLVSIKMLDSLPDTLVDSKSGKRTLTVLMYRKGLSLSTIRHICYIPAYISMAILYLILPEILKPGVPVVAATLLAQQIILRRDVKGRYSIVAASLTIIAFIATAIVVISLT